jgi:glycosyltransferase involved in cell wall biosynthesis
MPVYNAEPFLKETMDSILRQTFSDFELLTMDDGSTDRSVEIIQSYNDSRIQYIMCPHNFIATLNRGLEMAQGKYIALMDADDIMMPNRLQIQYEYMEQHLEIAACGGYMQTFGSGSGTIQVLTAHDDIVQYMLLGNPMANPTGFIRRAVLMEHHIRYEDGYSFAEDFKLWADIAKVGRLANIPKLLTRYRTSSGQTSVVNYRPMMASTCVIRYEMLQYFLKAFSPVEELGQMVAEKILPGIEQLNERGFFSCELYFKLMYELIHGLRAKGNFTV